MHQYPETMKLNDKIAIRSSIGAWWGSWISVGLFILTAAILENNRRNTAITAELVTELKSINSKLSNLG